MKDVRASSAPLDAALIRKLAAMFGLLSSPTRLRIFRTVAGAGELHVQAIADALGMRITAVSNQLRLLAIIGVLSARSEGLKVLYSLKEEWVTQLMVAGIALARNRRIFRG